MLGIKRIGAVAAIGAAATLFAACSADAPAAPEVMDAISAERAGGATTVEETRAVRTLKRVTARYHNLEAALADGFVLLHPCETRPDEGPVGIVYVHFGRLLDGVADPASPDALVYEPGGKNGRPTLVGAEFAIPYTMWSDPSPPEFLGHEFQPEDEFGVYGLHIWVWERNPNGLFAESNPRVSCGAEA